jgi:hypothetical protein
MRFFKRIGATQFCWLFFFLCCFVLIITAGVLCSEFLWLKRHLIKPKITSSILGDWGESKLIPLLYRPFLFEKVSIDIRVPTNSNVNVSLIDVPVSKFKLSRNASKEMNVWWDMGQLGAFSNAEPGMIQSDEYLLIPMNPGSIFQLTYNYNFSHAKYGRVLFEINEIFPDPRQVNCTVTETAGNCTIFIEATGWPNKQYNLGFLYYYKFDSDQMKLDPTTFQGTVSLSIENTRWVASKRNIQIVPCKMVSQLATCTIPLSWVGDPGTMSILIEQQPFNHQVSTPDTPDISIIVMPPSQRYTLHVFTMLAPPLVLIGLFLLFEVICCCVCFPNNDETLSGEKRRLLDGKKTKKTLRIQAKK